jgi:ribosomal 50S subunit-recycling heat shock protein
VRIDLLLHALCLFKTRSQAGRACAEGRVWLDGALARASRDVRPGSRIRWRDELGRTEEEIEVVEVPARQVSRVEAKEFYREVFRKKIEDPWMEG